ncbi:hypothetical protein GBAR_LOCUS2487 [Geodia barretti]|uniref:Uncharacterized protein n=1 Tax=Geodia barretti TaxID=519541 RepID=A0AA35R1F0_GEOBA|nr:hypothetical protein GBAR_LOCUS2487 [Geodia barretti]
MDLPGVRFILIRAPNTVVIDQVVTESVSGIDTGVFGTTLNVTLDQLDGAIGLEVRLTTPFGTSTIIPYTTIPLDTESCTSPTTVAAQNQGTCDAVDRMIRGARSLSCTRNTACNKTDCTSTSHYWIHLTRSFCPAETLQHFQEKNYSN